MEMVIVFYVDVRRVPVHEVERHLRRLAEKSTPSRADKAVHYLIPVMSESSVVYLNPRIMPRDEYSAARRMAAAATRRSGGLRLPETNRVTGNIAKKISAAWLKIRALAGMT